MTWMTWLIAAASAQDRITLDPRTEPQVIDLTRPGPTYVVPLDGSVDLTAFVLDTDQGEHVLDEVVSEAKEALVRSHKWQPSNIAFSKASVDLVPRFCVVLYGVQVCAAT